MVNHALILSGGKSRRMGKDKSLLYYNDKVQHERIFKLLDNHFDFVFFSVANNAKNHLKNYPHIVDIHPLQCGPILGILSALSTYYVPWFVLAIDMPAVSSAGIMHTIHTRNVYKKNQKICHACIAKSPKGDFLDPLFGVYEPEMLTILEKNFTQKNYSLQKILKLSAIQIQTVEQLSDDLININTQEDYNSFFEKN